MALTKWDLRHFEHAKFVSKRSKDPRKKVGAIVTEDNYVYGTGYNGFPTGIADTEERLNDKVLKNKLMLHAEDNAIHTARGKGDTIYVYPCLPCTRCLGKIIQAGIKRIVTGPLDPNSSWDQELVLELVYEAKLRIEVIE